MLIGSRWSVMCTLYVPRYPPRVIAISCWNVAATVCSKGAVVCLALVLLRSYVHITCWKFAVLSLGCSVGCMSDAPSDCQRASQLSAVGA